MYETILVATDGSDIARRAAAHGIELADGLGATIHALSVAKGYVNRDQIRADPEREAEQAVTAVREKGRSRDLDVITAVREGHPCEVIPAYAAEIGADIIVMGATVPSGITGMFQESVADCVYKNADVPVMIVNEKTGTMLSVPEGAEFTFRCPACEETMLTSEKTKQGLIERGCIMCGAEVSEDAFERGIAGGVGR